eukprot:11794835-Alexandrium_andersonii.AAC.1
MDAGQFFEAVRQDEILKDCEWLIARAHSRQVSNVAIMRSVSRRGWFGGNRGDPRSDAVCLSVEELRQAVRA